MGQTIVSAVVPVEPRVSRRLSATAPENPTVFFFIKTPYADHKLIANVVGYDTYTGNNSKELTISVLSPMLFWLLLLAVVVIVIAVMSAALKVTLERRSRGYWERGHRREYWHRG